MAHNLEQGSNGEVAFASLREPAWHGLGTVFNNEVTTAEMLRLAHLADWNVRLEPISTLVPEYNFITQPYMVVRDNPFDDIKDVLSVVGERYNVLQNEELFSFGDNILDGGGRWETAGSIKQGRVVFGSLALDRETVLDPTGVSDKINTYLLVHTSHDGSVAIQASVTPVRVVCQNTLNAALHGVKQSYKIRHTATVNGKVQAAREALGLAHAFMDEFDKMAHDLIQSEINKATFDKIVLAAYPKPDEDASKGAVTRWNNKIETIQEIYRSDTTNMIAGTAWGAYNALTERLDWYRNGRGAASNENVAAAASGFDPQTNVEKGRLLTIVKQLANV
jgi:phage/plasmid-like protein (TIGR03299 family)